MFQLGDTSSVVSPVPQFLIYKARSNGSALGLEGLKYSRIYLEPPRSTPVPGSSGLTLRYHTQIHRSRTRVVKVVVLPHSKDDLAAGLDAQRELCRAVVDVASYDGVGSIENRRPIFRNACRVRGVGGCG